MTNIATLELAFSLQEDLHDLLIAELDAGGFTGFVQEGNRLKAYVPSHVWNASFRQKLIHWLGVHQSTPEWQETEFAPQDWNQKWEASIQPIQIPPFFVRPSWAEPAKDLVNIIIDPKMSFGTGHHETTRLLLKMMPSFVETGSRVLDAGTGAAILAIAAVKLNATSVLAFDVDPWVTENVMENLSLNGVSDLIIYREGAMDVVTESGFDVVLANINRNVLLDYMKDFAEKVAINGHLMLSGVLVPDKSIMEEAASKEGFQLVEENHEGSWWAGVFRRL